MAPARLYGAVIGAAWWEPTGSDIFKYFFELMVFKGNRYGRLRFKVFYGCQGNADRQDLETLDIDGMTVS